MAPLRLLSSFLLPLLAPISLLVAPAVAEFAPGAKDAATLADEYGRLNNESLFWGPYRPNLYFGTRPRTPHSLMTGLMWGKIDTYTDFQDSVRYTCEQNEGMKGYGWDEYDARRGGVQSIHDTENGIDITTSFVKVPGGTHGGSWAVRIRGQLHDDVPRDRKTILFYYLSQQGLGSILESLPGDDERGYFDSEPVTVRGSSAALGNYKLVVTRGTGKQPVSSHPLADVRGPGQAVVQAATLPDPALWQAKSVVFGRLKEGVDWLVQNKYDSDGGPPPWHVYQLPNRPGHGNVQIVQRVFEGDFEFDVLFSSESAGEPLTSERVSREIAANSAAFNRQFARVFPLQPPYDADAKYQKFARSMFSNLLGGIGYFDGESVVDRSYAPEYEEEAEGFWEDAAEARARQQQALEGPYELFTSIPSRPFFPRGFLWDEGFHLLPILDWDADLAMDIVRSWFSLMDEDGWIAREQILGAEARSKVPDEFQVQYPHYANPPTLFLVLDAFVDKLLQQAEKNSKEKAQGSDSSLSPLASASVDHPDLGFDQLRRLYPLLRRQLDWFRRTQSGDLRSYDRPTAPGAAREGFRWRGRTPTHCLTSGLDDYPRAQPPHPAELHVDLLSWVGMAARTLARITEAVPDIASSLSSSSSASSSSSSLGEDDDNDDDDDDEEPPRKDKQASTEAAELARLRDAIAANADALHWSDTEGCYCDATVDDYEEHALVCHKGYISLFPFLAGLVRHDSPRLGRLLDMMADENELWSAHGLRSLSRRDPAYATAENYWRSPVWMNINYMAVVQLKNVATRAGPHQAKARDLYTRLRRNLVDTVFASWAETGFAWEQYDPETGRGQRTQHFTGWTSLVVKLMTMDDLAAAGEEGKGTDEEQRGQQRQQQQQQQQQEPLRDEL